VSKNGVEGVFWVEGDELSDTLSNVEDREELVRDTDGEECVVERTDIELSVRRLATCIRSRCLASACCAHSCRAFMSWSDCS
jgi:hypothetical protein